MVLSYDNRFYYNKSNKFAPHWEGPFKVLEKFANGSYQLVDISGKLHQTRVNGWRLKPYFSQVFNEQEDLEKVKKAALSCRLCHGSSHMCYPKKQDPEEVSLNTDEPLGWIAQDPLLAPHVPSISGMDIGPITRPCIDTFLCDPGTSVEHLSIDREDECTSRLQENVSEDEEALELEA